MRAIHSLLLSATRSPIPRFGFRLASEHGIKCEWDIPDNVFMLLVLDQAKMEGVAGLATYRREFSSGS